MLIGLDTQRESPFDGDLGIRKWRFRQPRNASSQPANVRISNRGRLPGMRAYTSRRRCISRALRRVKFQHKIFRT